MIIIYFKVNFWLTRWVNTLRAELHVHNSAWRCCSAPEWNSHSGLSRLALHRDERTLQLVQLPFLGLYFSLL